MPMLSRFGKILERDGQRDGQTAISISSVAPAELPHRCPQVSGTSLRVDATQAGPDWLRLTMSLPILRQ